jgi:hypothetical protein
MTSRVPTSMQTAQPATATTPISGSRTTQTEALRNLVLALARQAAREAFASCLSGSDAEEFHSDA